MKGDPAVEFEPMYQREADPWRFASSWYERRRYEVTIALLPDLQGTFSPTGMLRLTPLDPRRLLDTPHGGHTPNRFDRPRRTGPTGADAVLVDVQGAFATTGELGFTPSDPRRVLDTRLPYIAGCQGSGGVG